eukprot:SM000011S18994  [mRNA]  locus=s11:254130:254467:+ [translate_table: standard]
MWTRGRCRWKDCCQAGNVYACQAPTTTWSDPAHWIGWEARDKQLPGESFVWKTAYSARHGMTIET